MKSRVATDISRLIEHCEAKLAALSRPDTIFVVRMAFDAPLVRGGDGAWHEPDSPRFRPFASFLEASGWIASNRLYACYVGYADEPDG